MKKQILSFLFIGSALASWSQTQIGNSNFETWEAVASGEEPTNWNSFLTAGGSLSGFASDQCESSTDVRPGTSGTKSLRIFSKSALGIIANGNCTVGKINMGSASPTNASNYNSSIITDGNFSEAFTDSPDSLVFWLKFTPASGNTTDSARVATIIHDNYAFRDPSDATSLTHIVATAIKNFGKTNGSWVRVSVPFTYSGPATANAFILLTFATNKTPGGGSADDEVLVDDVELIYNPTGAGIDEKSNSPVQVVNANGKITFKAKEGATLAVTITSSEGQVVAKGTTDQTFDITTAGVYLVHMYSDGKEYVQKIAVY